MSNESYLTSRQIKPFICSTDDFIDERNYLSTHIFPQLQALCRHREVSYIPYEWDHSLPDDRLQKGLSFYLALQCIDHASPFFIGLLGNQYGCHRHEDSSLLPNSVAELPPSADWIDKSIVVAAESGYTWLLDESYTSTSLYELKIIQAAFLGEETNFCRFYVREEVVGTSVDSLSESERYDKFKIQQLKASIAKRGLFVSYYTDVEELGELVLSEWMAIINQLYPPLDTYNVGVRQMADRVKHRRFGEKRCESLVTHDGVTKCFKELSEFASATNDYKYDPFIRAKHFEKSTGIRLLRKGRQQQSGVDHPNNQHKSVCVLTGPRGSGKTAIVSSWLQQEAEGIVPPETFVICHYAGCDRMSRNIAVFMKRCIAELRQEFLSKYDDELSMETEFSEFAQIKETFLATLALGPCIIVLDGLDEISASMGYSMIEMKRMDWLASPLPPSCKFIFTVTNSDLCAKSLHQRNDVMFRACPEIHNKQCKLDIFNEYLSQSRCPLQLSKAQTSRIAQYKLSSSPLYLNIIANELRDVSGDVEAHLDVYANIDSISTSTRDMWINLIKRWVRDYSWTRYRDDTIAEPRSERIEDTVICGWVPDCLRLIACSRDGLTVDEILGTLIYGMGYMGRRAVSKYDWYLFYNAARCVFYEKPNGLITINHEHLAEIIDYLLLGNISPPSLNETSSNAHSQQRLGGMERRQYHISLASHLLSKPADQQLVRIEEILWQLEIAADYTRLSNMLLIPSVMEKMFGSIYCTYTPLRIELVRFCRLLNEKKVDLTSKIAGQLEKLGFLASQQEVNEQVKADTRSNVDMSVADRQSATFSNLSQSELGEPAQKTAWNSSLGEKAELMSDNAVEDTPRLRINSAFDESEVISSYSRARSAEMQSRLGLTSVESSRQDLLPSMLPSEATSRRQSASVYQAGEAADGEFTAEEEVDDLTHDAKMMLISQPVSVAEVMNLAFTCAKLFIVLDNSKYGEEILESIALWAQQKYPLKDEELYILCHVYQELSRLSVDKHEYSASLEQLYKSHECALDISSDGDAVSDKLQAYIKAKLKIEMCSVCIKSKDLHLAQSFIDEARIGMGEIRCVSGTNYNLFNQGLLRDAQSNYLSATNYLLQCLDYFELYFGTMHPIVADISHSLGKLLSDSENKVTSDYAEAEEYLWKALNIRRERDSLSLATSDSLFQLAFLVQKQGSKTRKKEAMELLQNCLDIRTNKLGIDHDSTKMVVYLLNDLEISLQLGQYEFGMAKPMDSRSQGFPFSELTMHEKALIEYNLTLVRKQRATPPHKNNSAQVLRPQSAFNIERPRNESRLYQGLVRRPKTAPTTITRFEAIEDSKMHHKGLEQTEHIPCVTFLPPESELSTAESSPRTFRSYNRDPGTDSKMSVHSQKSSVLAKYYSINKYEQYVSTAENTAPASRNTTSASARIKAHQCEKIDSHTIHKNLHTTTLGPNSTVRSVVGYTRPPRKGEPIHQAAWYHSPNHYTTVQKPHINPRVYAERKKRLMQKRSRSSPVRSRFLNDHANTMNLIAQQDYALSPS